MPINTTAASTKSGNKVKVPLSPKAKERAEALEGLGQIGTVVCIAKGWFADAAAISLHGPAFFEETAKLGDSNEQIGRILDFLAVTGPYAAIIGAGLTLGMQIAANHKMIPVIPAMGVQPPEALEAEIKTAIMIQQAEALRAQREAQARLAQVEAEMAAHGIEPTS